MIYNFKLFNFVTDAIIISAKLDNKLILNYYKKILNGMLFEAHFPQHMKEKNINIMKYVKQDVNKALKRKTFEYFTQQQKEEIITELYKEWTHPDNEVRNRLKLFAVRSPDILKPILEN